MPVLLHLSNNVLSQDRLLTPNSLFCISIQFFPQELIQFPILYGELEQTQLLSKIAREASIVVNRKNSVLDLSILIIEDGYVIQKLADGSKRTFKKSNPSSIRRSIGDPSEKRCRSAPE
ncbi:hypothetical protein KO02_13690 [Sphingobacterium sp. ML3W]|uniref:hypothetical protein n=1 Tax=Sphingobacterium sp. ML3W TaxID=1538644 RepID=UPI0004F91949|nr:hypothetical protein [Sphingobacterium sp. ML3W]AIM37616.1 hypothetical protein KO02_13690 [Sphingobacterium sp. ML3W]